MRIDTNRKTVSSIGQKILIEFQDTDELIKTIAGFPKHKSGYTVLHEEEITGNITSVIT